MIEVSFAPVQRAILNTYSRQRWPHCPSSPLCRDECRLLTRRTPGGSMVRPRITKDVVTLGFGRAGFRRLDARLRTRRGGRFCWHHTLGRAYGADAGPIGEADRTARARRLTRISVRHVQPRNRRGDARGERGCGAALGRNWIDGDVSRRRGLCRVGCDTDDASWQPPGSLTPGGQ